MNDHELKRAFEAMTETVRPERVENRVRKRLAAKEERKRLRFPRAAAVFACVLALTAVSAGAYGVYRNIIVYPQADGHGPYSVTIRAGEEDVSFPLLSEETVERIKERCVKHEDESYEAYYERRMKFSSWENAEEELGIDLLTSDHIGEMIQNTIWGADILLSPVCEYDFISEQVTEEIFYFSLDAAHYAYYEDERFLCYTDITVPVSETFYYDYLSKGLYIKSGNIYTGDAEGEPEVMSYRTKNGLDAEIIGMYKRYEGNHIYDPLVYNVNAYVMHKGILYDITIWDNDRDFTLEAMYAILDSLK